MLTEIKIQKSKEKIEEITKDWHGFLKKSEKMPRELTKIINELGSHFQLKKVSVSQATSETCDWDYLWESGIDTIDKAFKYIDPFYGNNMKAYKSLVNALGPVYTAKKSLYAKIKRF